MCMGPCEPCKKIILRSPGGQRRQGQTLLRWIDGVEENARKLRYCREAVSMGAAPKLCMVHESRVEVNGSTEISTVA